MSMETLLIEIGTEELPPTGLRTLGEALHREVLARLDERLKILIRGLGRKGPLVDRHVLVGDPWMLDLHVLRPGSLIQIRHHPRRDVTIARCLTVRS